MGQSSSRNQHPQRSQLYGHSPLHPSSSSTADAHNRTQAQTQQQQQQQQDAVMTPSAAPAPSTEVEPVLHGDNNSNENGDRVGQRSLNRSSVRRSLMNLVKPPSRSRLDSVASVEKKKNRVSWRGSRRWSRARFGDEEEGEDGVGVADVGVGAGAAATTAGDATAATASASGSGDVSAPILEEGEKGKEREEGAEHRREHSAAAAPTAMGGSGVPDDDTRGRRVSGIGSSSSGPDAQGELERSGTGAGTAQALGHTQQVIPARQDTTTTATTSGTTNRGEGATTGLPAHPYSAVATEPLSTPVSTSTASSSTPPARRASASGLGLRLGGMTRGDNIDERRSSESESMVFPPPPSPSLIPPHHYPHHHNHNHNHPRRMTPGRAQPMVLPPATPLFPQQQQQASVPVHGPQGGLGGIGGNNNRQFPPPGTLVVVQGIVHTTDVSRLGAGASGSGSGEGEGEVRGQDRGSANANRISALLGRGAADGDRLPAGGAGEGSGVEQGAGGGEVGDGRGESGGAAAAGQGQSQQRQQQQRDERPNSSSAISSSSIDVLGTLLSVAAAATAASLLTGSSEPILSSGLAPPASGSTGSAASASASASPSSPFASAPAASASTSPTLNVPSSNTSNLLPSAFFSPPPPPPPLPSFISSNLNSNSNSNSGSARHIGVGDMSPAGRAERMRQAWGTIRERLGLRANSPSSPSSSPSSSSSSSPLSSSSTSSSALYSPSSSSPTSGFGSGSGSGSNATPTSASSPASLLSALAPASPFGGGGSGRDRERNQTLTDTREQMLAEMARAFNIGLGLGAGEEQAQSREQSREQGQRQEQQEAGGQRDRERRGESGGMGAGAGSGEGERDREREREREREAEMPPEGSFERFLVELQADLRVALTQDRGEEHERGEREGGAEREREPEREPEREERRETPVPETRERVPSVRSLVPTEPASDNEDADMPPLQDVSFSDSDYEGPEESVEDDFSSVNTSPTGEAPRAQATNESSARPTDGGTPRAGLDASGRINWWRLYRFPPVMSARTGGPGPTGPGTMPTMLASASPFGPSVPMGGPAFGGPGLSDTYSPMFGNGPSSSSSGGGGGGAPAREGASGASARAGNGNGNGGGNAASVVPVIIVGLQSVNAPGWMGMDDGADLFDDVPHDRHHHHHHHNHHHQRGATMPDLGEEDEDEDAFFGGFGPSMAARQERRRAGGSGGGGWQNRAASALRNLRSASGTGAGAGAGTGGGAGIGIGVGNRRSQGLGMDGLGGLGGIGGHGQGMGRRQQQQQQQQQPLPPMIGGPGSRTFLIYVIGGYYPPDHSIVTGGPDNLESFEALLELVELLGNAKAATATKEDIEKSGLEVIKKSQLTEYERDNKVSSNCVERCLICLDDYEEQDEIRVMGCRHAFHRGCVDKWLQTGKNNCPACRSRGVSTEGPSPTQTAT